MPDRVVIVDTGYSDYDTERQILEGAGYVLDVAEGCADRRSKIDFCKGAVGLLVRGTPLDGTFMDSLPGLRAIVRYGVGYDNIDVDAATDRGIRVANVRGYASHSVSDHALALLFACLRGLLKGHSLVQTHYGALPWTPIMETREATLGIIGLGNIGGTLCQKARCLFQRILAHDPYQPRDRFQRLGAEPVELDPLLRQSDIITIHCDINEETADMIDWDAFARMERCPILINTARGAIVDEEALLHALETGQISAAGWDVFTEEPPGQDSAPLLSHPRIVATGHYAWYSKTAEETLKRKAAENLVSLLRGDLPPDCLNP